MISCAVIVSRLAYRNASTSNSPSPSTNRMRFSEARLQDVSLMNENSEHGFVATWRALLATGFQSLIVVSYWMPGSPQIHAASAMRRKIARALSVLDGSPVVTSTVVHEASSWTASMNASVARTEWFAL